MTTALEMLPAIGAKVRVRFESMQIDCTVKNVKNSWGQPRLLVSPVAGTGEQWVEMGRVTVIVTKTPMSPEAYRKWMESGEE